LKIITNLNVPPHQLKVDAFNAGKDKLPCLTESNCSESLPPGSTVNAVFSLDRISIGSYGVV